MLSKKGIDRVEQILDNRRYGLSTSYSMAIDLLEAYRAEAILEDQETHHRLALDNIQSQIAKLRPGDIAGNQIEAILEVLKKIKS